MIFTRSTLHSMIPSIYIPKILLTQKGYHIHFDIKQKRAITFGEECMSRSVGPWLAYILPCRVRAVISSDHSYEVIWASWRHRSPVIRVFVQHFIRPNITETSKFRITKPFMKGTHRWLTDGFPSQMASNALIVFPFHNVIMWRFLINHTPRDRLLWKNLRNYPIFIDIALKSLSLTSLPFCPVAPFDNLV